MGRPGRRLGPDLSRVAVWGVGGGIVGARLYHLATSWDQVPDEWWGPLAVWEGGLGIWGGIAGGVLVGGIVAKRAGASVTALLDAAAPGLLVAQAIGRIGNWWNQELFGEPTGRPWGLEIDPSRRPDDYLFNETFHPTFLYEGLWCLAAAGLLILLDRRYTFRPRRSSRSTSPSIPASASISRRFELTRPRRSPAGA